MAPERSRIAVYDGRTLLGYIVERDGKWHAFAPDGRAVGVFPTRQLAARAL